MGGPRTPARPPFYPTGTVAQSPDQARQGAHLSGAAGGSTIPGYETVGELGRGAMGVVYKARDTRLNRVVAIKTILHADAAGRAAVARFWAEAEVMAAVRHPHVVQVFELGEHAGRPFLVMEHLPGGSLAARLRSGPLPPAEGAALVAKIARGVAAAHDLGIVHRDLKPANVLLDAAGEPRVTDFGLAKRRAADLTATQALMGTPAYMAPGQAAGRAKFVGPPCDVWALGVILYECLAGKRPFEGESTEELLGRIATAEPVAVRTRSGRSRGTWTRSPRSACRRSRRAGTPRPASWPTTWTGSSAGSRSRPGRSGPSSGPPGGPGGSRRWPRPTA